MLPTSQGPPTQLVSLYATQQGERGEGGPHQLVKRHNDMLRVTPACVRRVWATSQTAQQSLLLPSSKGHTAAKHNVSACSSGRASAVEHKAGLNPTLLPVPQPLASLALISGWSCTCLLPELHAL